MNPTNRTLKNIDVQERVYNSLPSSDFRMPSWLRRPYTPSNAGNSKTDSLWRVNHSFRLHIQVGDSAERPEQFEH